MKSIDLSGKTLLITGGSGGIGSAICKSFAQAGAAVIAPEPTEMDLLSEASIDSYLNGLSVSPDLVIHSAGINELAGIAEVSRESLDRVFQVNLFSFITILNRLVPAMREKGYGRIVGISSLYGIVSRERRIPYSASKHAMTGLIQSTALEVAGDNVLINGVAPGYVMTDMTRKNLSEAEIDALKRQIPTGRLQEASEIADLCLFLCSSLNQSITGRIIPVDGGFLCR
ncbi:MAG: SDR family oxidoreductase [Clostridia bacterium]|nr:SDR family oxidoreductase [Clostridia bacterium]